MTRQYYDRISVVLIHEEQCYGTVEKLGVYGSVVKYTKDGIEKEELLDNQDFTIVDEIVFEHVEESE